MRPPLQYVNNFIHYARCDTRSLVKEKGIVRRTLTLWHDNKLDIVDCYLIACLEGDRQNILYSYDRDFDKFEIDRKEP